MSYYFAKTLPAGFDETLQRVRDVLQQEGFGVITEIDVKSTFKAKLGIEFRKYHILGACNPARALLALQIDDKVGTMLPCNVVVQDAGGGRTEVAAVDPVVSMMGIDNPSLREAAAEVQRKLRKVIQNL